MMYTSSTAQSSSKNYVQTKTYLDSGGTTFLRHIDYYDELGYVAETVDYLSDVTNEARTTYDDTEAYSANEYDDFLELAGRFNESVTYNPNGSITSLLRNGMKNDGTFGAIDDLTITYDGNRLLKVTDDAEALNYNGVLDFDDGDDSANEHHYDSNGALTYDSNRGINSITYDYAHYPSVISRTAKKKTVYNDYTPEAEAYNGKVSVTVWEDSSDNLGICTRERYNDSGLDGHTLAETGILNSNGDRIVSLYMYPKSYEEKTILNTVANIQNLLGAHEFLGHYKKGWRPHTKVVPFQRKHSTWNKTTQIFKEYNYKVYGK